VARRRAAGMRLMAWALARLAKRAKDAIRLDGMCAFIGTVIPSARTAFKSIDCRADRRTADGASGPSESGRAKTPDRPPALAAAVAQLVLSVAR